MQSISRKQETRVGLISILAVLILIGAIVWAKGVGVGGSTRTVTMNFSNASGIDVGSPVTFKGVRKGVVTALDARAEGVLVTATVDSDLPVTTATVPQIQMAELTGGKKIELVTKAGNALPLKEGTVMQGELQGDINELLAAAGDMTRDVRHILSQVDTTMSAVNSIVTNRRLVQGIETSVLNLEEASGAARELVISNRAGIAATLSSLRQTTGEMQGLLRRTSPAIERTVDASAAAIEDLRRIATAADISIRNADTLIARLDTIAYDVKNGDGTVSRLLYDRRLADELARTVLEARQLLQQIKRYGVNINVSLGSKP